jgi:hypothetical protein
MECVPNKVEVSFHDAQNCVEFMALEALSIRLVERDSFLNV